jgi:hypothetical protein
VHVRNIWIFSRSISKLEKANNENSTWAK